MHRLDGSLQHAFDVDDALGSLISYRRAAARLKVSRPVLAVGIGRSRSDLCPICRCWDVLVSKDIANSLFESIQLLLPFDATYFDKFKEMGFEKGWSAPGFKCSECPDFIQAFADFAGSTVHADPELHMLEATIKHKAHMLAAEARAHQMHWSLRTAIYIDANALLLRPPLGWIILQSDYKKP